jgi:hypothetical protein
VNGADYVTGWPRSLAALALFAATASVLALTA